MKNLLLLACAITLAACGSASPEITPEEMAAMEAENDEMYLYGPIRKRVAQLDYPECAVFWQDDKLTPCGAETFKVSLDFCRAYRGVGDELHPLSAGDSWIQRAGRSAVRTDEERVRNLRESSYIDQHIAYALGDGTDGIRVVECSLDKENLRVTFVDWEHK